MKKQKDNFSAINEIREMLGTTKKITLESFIMPEEEDSYADNNSSTVNNDEVSQSKNKTDDIIDVPQYSKQIKEAIIQIRKIAIGVIAQLANEVSSNSYQYMKKVLDMSDKALGEMNGNEHVNS